MNIWLLLFWGILAGIALIVLVCFGVALVYRVYWREREAHTQRMGVLIQQAAKAVKSKNGSV